MQEPASHPHEREAPTAPPPLAEEESDTSFSFPASFSFNQPVKWRGEDERPPKSDATAYYAWLEKFEYDFDYILAYSKESGQAIPEALAQKFYHKLLLKYAGTYEKELDEGRDDDARMHLVDGSAELEEYESLKKATTAKPIFDTATAKKIYLACLKTYEPENCTKFEVLHRETGFTPDDAFIEEHILNDSTFGDRSPFPISDALLESYLGDADNQDYETYRHTYRVSHAYELFLHKARTLGLSADPSDWARGVWCLGAVARGEMENVERYPAVRAELLHLLSNPHAGVRTQVAECLADLASMGDTELGKQLLELVMGIQPEGIPESTALGLTPEQVVAVRTLLDRQMSNFTNNKALLRLVMEEKVDPRLQRVIAQRLLQWGAFPPGILMDWNEIESDLQNLRFVYASWQVSNASTREKLLVVVSAVHNQSVTDHDLPRLQQYSNIPDDAMLPLFRLTSGWHDLLQSMDDLYLRTKSSSERERLLQGITAYTTGGMIQRMYSPALRQNETVLKDFDSGAARARYATLRLVGHRHLIDTADADTVATFMKTAGFMQTVLGERMPDLSREEELFTDLAALNARLLERALMAMREVLPSDLITIEKLQALIAEWGDIEPIFTYAAKLHELPATRNYFAELVGHFDPPLYKEWQAFRYNIEHPAVKEQIGYLTFEQREAWQKNRFQELGDVMVQELPNSKPKAVANLIMDAIEQGHVYNVAVDTDTTYEAVQDDLGNFLQEIDQYPEQHKALLEKRLAALDQRMRELDVVIRYAQKNRIVAAQHQLRGRIKKGKAGEPDTVVLDINTKTKTALAFVRALHPPEQFDQFVDEYAACEALVKEGGSREIPLTSFDLGPIDAYLTEEVEGLEAAHNKVMQSGGYASSISAAVLLDPKRLFATRQELTAKADLYRLLALTPKLIAENKIKETEDKGGMTITDTMKRLKEYMKGNATFLQDLANVEAVLAREETIGRKRRLAMIFTDDPQMLLQIGKYPIGCGSCQNFEGDERYNKALPGYIGDAHIKGAFLVDLNKLSEERRKEIDEQGFEMMKDRIPKQELLEASIAREIVKLERNPHTPAVPPLFLQPTYSVVNKADGGMDKYFNMYLNLTLRAEMQGKLFRGNGKTRLQVSGSRNPSGQYEDAGDGDAANPGMGIKIGPYTLPAHEIENLSPESDEDRRLTETISRGSI